VYTRQDGKKKLSRTTRLLLLLVVGIASLVRFDVPPERLMAKYAAAPSKFLDVGGLRVPTGDEGGDFPSYCCTGPAPRCTREAGRGSYRKTTA